MANILNYFLARLNGDNKDVVEEAKKTGKQLDETFSDVANRIIELDNSVTNKTTKAAAYRAEYEKLMSEKKLRALTASEKSRAKVLKSSLDYYESLRKNELENLKLNLNLGKISNEEYYSALAQIRDQYFETGSSQWAKYTLEIAKYNKKVIDEQKKELEGLFSEIDKKYTAEYNELLKKQDTMREKLESLSQVYNKVTVGSGDKQYSWIQLSDIDTELKVIKEYNSSLLKVKDTVSSLFKDMGVGDQKAMTLTKKFFESLAGMQIWEANGFANYLSNLEKSRLTDYLTKWAEKIDISEQISKNLYSDESQDLAQRYAADIGNSFESALKEKFKDVPESFFSVGDKSCEQFKNGFLSAIDKVMEDISRQVALKIETITQAPNSSSVTNNSNYNIYEAKSPADTALEIFKYNERERLLTDK